MDTADRLRNLYDYAATHRTYSLELLLEAASEIKQLRAENEALREEIAERDAEAARTEAKEAARSLEQMARDALARARADLQGREASDSFVTQDLAVKYMREATGLETVDCRPAIRYVMKHDTDVAEA